jgi:D-alanyl-lipoteichoic acid acyltransferase DltB (MBOAT superfamily)
MIELSLQSSWFLLALFLGPIIMGFRIRCRRWLFLLFNAGLFLASLGTWQSAVAVFIFVSPPYIYLLVIKKWDFPIWPVGILQVVLFIYLNKYAWIISLVGLNVPTAIKVVGISYILFRQWDVLQQVKSGLVEKVPIVDYLNYLFSFWTLLAGPIQRYREFITTFYDERSALTNKETLACFHRVANGLLKVIVISSFFKYIWETAYEMSMTQGISVKYIVAMFYGYPLYLYFNFSGYCDVVIAIGRWVGFKIPENFDKPYLARDMMEMWNRWHRTLSQLIRDYLFQPTFKFLISGPLSRQIKVAQYVSIFITFFLVGVWHGTKINFVVFGLLQGLGMVFSLLYRDQSLKLLGKQRYNIYHDNPWVKNIERFICLHFWCFTFLFFEYDIFEMTEWLLQLGGL